MPRLRNEAPIGVFDAGLGGLTLLRALVARFPREDLVYVADTARAPYGTRTDQTIKNYAHACAPVLRNERIKLLVVASHSVSAIANEGMSGELFVPAIGPIGASARAAVAASAGKRIGVLASAATIRSGAYGHAIAALESHASVFAVPAPLLVALAEEGWIDGETARQAVRAYLAPLIAQQVDTLVLGTASFAPLTPLVRRELALMSDTAVSVVDGAAAHVEEVAEALRARQLESAREDPGELRIIVTDMPDDLAAIDLFYGADHAKLNIKAVDV